MLHVHVTAKILACSAECNDSIAPPLPAAASVLHFCLKCNVHLNCVNFSMNPMKCITVGYLHFVLYSPYGSLRQTNHKMLS